MDFIVEEFIDYPRDVVYKTLRDRLPDLVPFLPNVKKIEVLEKKKKKSGVYLLNKWYGDYKIPGIVKKIVKIDDLSWLDHATWIDNEYACEWKLVPVIFSDYVDAHGRNEIVEDGKGTRVVIKGVLNVDVSGHPAVPRLLAGRINKEVEKIALFTTKPNLQKLMQGLRDYLGEKK